LKIHNFLSIGVPILATRTLDAPALVIVMRTVFVFMGLLAAGPSLAAPHVTVAEIRKVIQVEGPKNAVMTLWSANKWEAFMDKISSGDGTFIALAPEIRPGTDAGSAEDLTNSLAEGLPRNPRAVLRVLDLSSDVVLGVENVCSVPLIDDTEARARAYKVKALRAVRSVYKSQDLKRWERLA
jgi:hypothetical protein